MAEYAVMVLAAWLFKTGTISRIEPFWSHPEKPSLPRPAQAPPHAPGVRVVRWGKVEGEGVGRRSPEAAALGLGAVQLHQPWVWAPSLPACIFVAQG